MGGLCGGECRDEVWFRKVELRVGIEDGVRLMLEAKFGIGVGCVGKVVCRGLEGRGGDEWIEEKVCRKLI